MAPPLRRVAFLGQLRGFTLLLAGGFQDALFLVFGGDSVGVQFYEVDIFVYFFYLGLSQFSPAQQPFQTGLLPLVELVGLANLLRFGRSFLVLSVLGP